MIVNRQFVRKLTRDINQENHRAISATWYAGGFSCLTPKIDDPDIAAVRHPGFSKNSNFNGWHKGKECPAATRFLYNIYCKFAHSSRTDWRCMLGAHSGCVYSQGILRSSCPECYWLWRLHLRESYTTRNVYWSRASVCVRVYVCVSVCLYDCLSAAACQHYCTDPDVTWGMLGGAPSCALLSGFEICARVALLWQHSANAKC